MCLRDRWFKPIWTHERIYVSVRHECANMCDHLNVVLCYREKLCAKNAQFSFWLLPYVGSFDYQIVWWLGLVAVVVVVVVVVEEPPD